MKTIVIGVMPQEQIRARAIAIAKGEDKPKPGEPRIWFTSMKSVAECTAARLPRCGAGLAARKSGVRLPL
jgi:predicted transcriptional regulator